MDLYFWTDHLALAGHYFPSQYPRWPHWQYWGVGIAASVLLFALVLAHELTHSLVAQSRGEEVRSITLFIFGGVAEIAHEPETAGKEFVIALVGPLSSLSRGMNSTTRTPRSSRKRRRYGR